MTEKEVMKRLLKNEYDISGLKKDMKTIKNIAKWIIALLVGVKASLIGLLAKGFNLV